MDGLLFGIRNSLSLLVAHPDVILFEWVLFFISGLTVGIGVWMFESGVLYAISMFFGGSGNFRRLLAYVGWSYLPLILGLVLVFPLLWFSLPDGLSLSTLEVPVLFAVGTFIIGFITQLWRGYIWVFALEQARELTNKQALITAGIPIALYVAGSLIGILFLLFGL